MQRNDVEKATILRGLVGSTVHGLSIADGNDDRDEMGICLEPVEYVVGLKSFEQLVYRTAEDREGKNARSRAGDLDLVIYSLKKYVRLALAGNPTILNLLFTPQRDLVVCTAAGHALRGLAGDIVSRQAAGRYLGYLTSQKQRLLGQRGQKDVRRPELEGKYGYDTKYAMHMLRLGYQGVELLETGRITLPMPDASREVCRNVRFGEYKLEHVLSLVAGLEVQLAGLRLASPLPERPDTAKVEEFIIDTYLSHWGWQ